MFLYLSQAIVKIFGSLEELPWECFQLLDLRRDVEANWGQEDFFFGSAELLPRLPKPRLHNHGLSQACQAHGFENFQVFLSCVLKKLPNEVTFFRILEVDKIAKAR